ncbi:uncharacterized protein PG986_012431 [Apiospora aurea]|uniref:Uncharacterized protein n=1 Tax=Apiospora aurea TaxID=335848 RepID=A0ABR1Q009_9PEZI
MRPFPMLFMAGIALVSQTTTVHGSSGSNTLAKQVSCQGTHIVPGTPYEGCGFYRDDDNSMVYECPLDVHCVCAGGKATCIWA